MDIAHCVSDHLLRNYARTVSNDFLKQINGRPLSLVHMNHGVVTEEIMKWIDAGAVWGILDLGFAADDAASKLCVEEPHDFRYCVACSAIPLFLLFPLFQLTIYMWKTKFGWKYAE